MSITFKPEENQFLIETENTVYAFHIAYNRFLQHDFYGTKTAEPPLYKAPYHSFSPYHDVWSSSATAQNFSKSKEKRKMPKRIAHIA